jgi:hypothetical protein
MMLLAPPGDGVPTPTVWTVSSESRKTIIAHYGDIKAEATLTKAEVPDGWSVIGNRALAEKLLEEGVPS